MNIKGSLPYRKHHYSSLLHAFDKIDLNKREKGSKLVILNIHLLHTNNLKKTLKKWTLKFTPEIQKPVFIWMSLKIEKNNNNITSENSQTRQKNQTNQQAPVHVGLRSSSR